MNSSTNSHPIHAQNNDADAPSSQVDSALIKQMMSDGTLPSETSPALVRDVIFGTLEHTVRGQVARGEPISVRHTAGQVVDLVLAGKHSTGPEPDTAQRLGSIEEKLDRLLCDAARPE